MISLHLAMVGCFWGVIEKRGENMKDERCMTVEEASEYTGAAQGFIRMAIQQGTFPGAYIKNGGKATFHIPRKAVEEYMEHYYRSPEGELIAALMLKLSGAKEKAPLADGTQNEI